MLFGRHVNKYLFRYLPYFLIGIATLVFVDVVQTRIPEYLGQIIDQNNELKVDLDGLGAIVGGILFCAAGMFIGRVVWRLTIFRASTGIAARLRQEMFEHAESLSASYYHENKVGNIMNWFTSDIEEISDFYGWGTVMLVDAVFLSLIVLVKMFRLNPWLSLLAAIPLVLIIVWGALVEYFMSKKWENRQKEYDLLYDFAQENFTGIRVIKSFVKQNKEIHAFAKIAKKNQDVNVSFGRMSVLFDVLIQVILIIEMAFIMGFGGYLVYAVATGNPLVLFGKEVVLSTGQLMEFLGYIELIVWPMIALGQIMAMRSRAKGSLKRISAFLDSKPEIVNPENAVALTDVKGAIEFKDFSFDYPGQNRTALSHIDLAIKPGQHIGIVGKIGSGKTTLVNVLFHLYNIEKGKVFIDGVDLMDIDIYSLRDAIAYAPQDNFLFSDKISNNIAFSSDSPEMDRVVESASFADVASNIDDFPRKYDTVSGERGVTLSGGQKQRVSIARAFYKKAPILVMDDCVSAVDVKTEETILGNIARERKDQTTLLIASRVSSVVHMDKIIVLEEGNLVGFGSHNELMKSCPTYQRMVYLQELEKEVEGGAR